MANAPQNQRRRRPKSRYGTQLQEKQDLKGIYGIRNTQLRNYFKKALALPEETGPALITLLERRLDSAIFRSGFAQTRPQARQMATHKLFEVNGRPVDVPSLLLKPGDIVTIRESKRGKSYFSNFDKRIQNSQLPSWMELDAKSFGFKIIAHPTADEANVGIDIRSIVEFFAR